MIYLYLTKTPTFYDGKLDQSNFRINTLLSDKFTDNQEGKPQFYA
jgi:hypothetical protein